MSIARAVTFLFLALFMAACNTAYKPERGAQLKILISEARTIVQLEAIGKWVPVENGARIQRIDTLYSGLRIVTKSGTPHDCKFRALDPVLDVHPSRHGHSVWLKGCKIKSKHSDEMYIGYDLTADQGRRFVDAIHVLKQHYLVVAGPDTQEQYMAFEAVARQYRASPKSHVLPEPAAQLVKEAETAANENRVDDAIVQYDGVLDLAPWWPPGYYRRGLLNGELGEYAAGIRDLNKYLKLEPGTQDAQVAKSLIYEWQSMLLRSKSGR